MKRLLTLLFAVTMLSITACGPNAAEEAKRKAAETAKMDSIFKAASQSMSTALDSVAKTAVETAKPAEPAKAEEKK